MSRRAFFFSTIQSGSRYVTFSRAVVLLPLLPASARTIAVYARIPSTFDNYIIDNRDRDGSPGAGNGYIHVAFSQGIDEFVGATQESAPRPLLLSGQWVRLFLEYAEFHAPTIFARYSWNSGGDGSIYTGSLDVAEVVVYDHLLSSAEKSDAEFPAAGVLARYNFQNLATTYINNTAASLYPLPDISGNGHDAQVGVAQGGSIEEVF